MKNKLLNRTRITDTTLVCIDCRQYGSAIAAIEKSIAQCEFDRVLFLTDRKFSTNPEIETVLIPKINSKEEYSKFVMKHLYEYITTPYMIVCQSDGYILNGALWDDEWKQYDYLGACWPHESDGFQVGNGGFSFRSRDLMERVATDPVIVAYSPEDSQISRTYRHHLERKYDFKWAPVEVADKFAFELGEPIQPTFGFHGHFHEPYRPTVILKRTGALGDIITMEPVMAHLNQAGYNVVIDCPVHLYEVFSNHWYPIRHISQFDSGRIPATEIDLDMAYEVKPDQLHLKSYFELVGVEPKDYRNPSLTVGNNLKKLFKKYAVIHIDDRETLSRNITGIEWKPLVSYLENNGYTVLQIGNQHHKVIATEINTPTIAFLKWVIAGSDLFIGIDSGPAQIAVACDVESVIFFGSVDCQKIYADLSNIHVIERVNVCRKPKCWHSAISTNGVPCIETTEDNPTLPCTEFNQGEVFNVLKSIVTRR